MTILGISYKKISAERKSKPLKANIKTTPKIKNVKKTKISETKQDVLNVSFAFETDYNDHGKITLEGNLLYMNNKEELDKILKEWDKNKKLPLDTDIEIKNYLLRKVVVQSLYISDVLNLPPVIELPRIVKKKK